MKGSTQLRPSVEKVFLNKKRAPVITITRISTYPSGRSVGFVYNVLPDGRLVIATARHVFLLEDDPSKYLFGLADYATKLELQDYAYSRKENDDIVFLIMAPVPGFMPIVFGRPRSEDVLARSIYLARNCIGEGNYPLGLTVQENVEIHYDTIVFRRNEGIPSERVDSSDISRLEELRSEGASELRLAQYYTRAGFSGSPIWDDLWNLHGMSVGGTAGNSPHGDQGLFYPSSYLDQVWEEINSSLSI